LKIGGLISYFLHIAKARLLDKQGLGSILATKLLINKIEKINPDIIHLHQIHGYYLNYELFFTYLAQSNKKIVWTFHDCWAFTGHCCYFTRVNCLKWKTECNHCPLINYYPKSLAVDNSKNNFLKKKELFTSLGKNLTVVSVSNWVDSLVSESFLKETKRKVIYNGVDLNIFKNRESNELRLKHKIGSKKVILGVANIWSDLKGLNDFLSLAKLIGKNEVIILIGLDKIQIANLPPNVIGITRTENQVDLSSYYSLADVFVSTSLAESFGLVTAESLACGTPIVAYNSTATPELVKEGCGFVVEAGHLLEMHEKINVILNSGKEKYSLVCRNTAVKFFNKDIQYKEYIELYKNILAKNENSNKMKYQICTKTIMDTSDPNILFDENGISDYYHNFHKNIFPNWHPDESGLNEILAIAKKIKKEGVGKDFDCIIGLSGGLDSSYTTYVAKEILGLRPLLFHVDAGWNTEQAVSNIEKLCNGLGLDLFTEVINWEEMKDLQVAYLKAQIPGQDAPQDIAFFSALYKFARKNRIKYVLTGSNYSTECCREPQEWGAYPGIDKIQVLDIHKKFGKRELKTFPIVDILTYKVYYQKILGMTVFKPLNNVPFIKKEAEDLLEGKFGWQKFQHKHHESRFTRFYEDYWLPRKFGFEKRRAHFSSLILTGQMTREEAMDRISRPELDEQTLKNEFEYVAHKLDLTVAELQKLFEGENRTFKDYKNKRHIISLGAKVLTALGLENRLFR
jgi:N-acetyl sugar amidotransferase